MRRRCDADDAGTGDDDDDELDAVELWCYLDTMSNMPWNRISCDWVLCCTDNVDLCDKVSQRDWTRWRTSAPVEEHGAHVFPIPSNAVTLQAVQCAMLQAFFLHFGCCVAFLLDCFRFRYFFLPWKTTPELARRAPCEPDNRYRDNITFRMRGAIPICLLVLCSYSCTPTQHTACFVLATRFATQHRHHRWFVIDNRIKQIICNYTNYLNRHKMQTLLHIPYIECDYPHSDKTGIYSLHVSAVQKNANRTSYVVLRPNILFNKEHHPLEQNKTNQFC